ncbi:MAG: voltage-gated sodium channel [Ponticaulis sp.]|nr:voltage-gated sodium channel [Ponticaulis sp.]
MAIVEHSTFKNTITALIVLNAITLGVDTIDGLPDGFRLGLRMFDSFVLGVFVIELSLKIYAYRLEFFRSGWNIFDLVIVGIALVPGSKAFQVLRSLRVLRVLRLLHVVPMMKRIVEALFTALPGMGAILAVLALLVYAGSVMATTLYGRSDDPEVYALFHDLPSSAFTLFQVMTMDGWRNEVVQKVMDDGHPYAWVFFLVFIFLASFAVLNLFIALIVEALQAEQEAAQEETIEQIEEDIEDVEQAMLKKGDEILSVIAELKAEIAELKAERRG